MSFNLATILRETATATPGHAACRTADADVTFAELDALSDRYAAGLAAAGLRPGDKVAVQLPNGVEFLTAYFGILKAGMVMVPMNPLLTEREVEHQMTDSGARLMVTPETFGDAGGDVDGEPTVEIAPVDPDDTAVLIYTSGTTGRPKGAELTHFQLYMNCTISGDAFGVREGDVTLMALPMFHVFGLSGVVNVAVRYGSTMSVVPRFETQAVLNAMHDHRVSVFVGVPAMYHAVVNADLGDRDLSALRIGSSGGAAMPEALMRRFEERFGVVILEGYGMTETASTATLNHGPEARRPLSIGTPVWGVEAKVVGPSGASLPPGPENVGELLIKGHNVTKGYHGDPAATATAEAIRDGWLHTGDLAYKDADGYLYIVDRIKDLIIRGGYNVYPREVEEVLHAHPAVAEAAVVGRPDERLGEEVVAAVSPRPGTTVEPDEIIAFCRERLAAYKYPREVRVLPELPKNASGKILKRELRTP
ncbi:long-chain fatty acid--CoA ligase [Actinomadura barringtoniae]|uniref:Long-chain fatty acid--CoA ligase n=1 Tax=Actinomadura barringtoniae TaxID=1427535 RepID=A0A939PL14_9ACTN|nr:long-chain fatty acid--CoA ligase [Actinomadura barringtoniae]MBO2454033.1 long-chain fatty acid--CoA ligase [Actinomadura barringtoniae]